MFDIGFAELLVIGIVGLLVIGPERLPGAIRTGSLWLNRIRRGFNEIKLEVQQELHNDSVIQDLRKTGEQLKDNTQAISADLQNQIQPPEATAQHSESTPTTQPEQPSASTDTSTATNNSPTAGQASDSNTAASTTKE